MTKVTTLLKTVREEKGYELSEISKKIKIPVKYLAAFEDGNIHHYPHEPYCSLSVKEYADFLGLDGQEILKIFRRDYVQKTEVDNVISKSNGITPKVTFTVLVVFIIGLFTIYLGNEYLKYTQPPQLTIDWPSLVTTDVIEITGKTNPDATVRINQDLVIVNSDGTFSKKISLKTDTTKVVVESQSLSGKSTIQEKTFTLSK